MAKLCLKKVKHQPQNQDANKGNTALAQLKTYNNINPATHTRYFLQLNSQVNKQQFRENTQIQSLRTLERTKIPSLS